MTAFASPQGPDRLPEPSVNLQVVVLFENIRCGLRAKQAFDHLLSEMEIDATFRFEPVGFEFLRDSAIRSTVARAAAGADIIVVAPEDAEIPSHVESWLRQWMKGRTHSTAALVVSLEESVSDDSNTANSLHHILELASQPGITLFHHFAVTPTVEASASLLDIWQTPRRATS